MRNSKLIIALLVCFLIAGAAVAVWAVLDANGNDNGRQAGPVDDGGVGALDGGDPLDDPSRNVSALPKDPHPPDPKGDPSKNPGKDPSGVDPKGLVDPKPNPDPKNDPKAKASEFEAFTYEVTIRGKVTFKSDGRAAVGAKVSAEISTDEDFMGGWGRDRTSARPETAPDRPKGSVSGNTTSDGVGEYRMALTVTGYREKGLGEMEVPDSPSDMLVVVATMSGYAPARSPSQWVTPGGEEEVNLKLAIPAAVRGRVIDALSREGVKGATGQFTDVDSWRDGGSQALSFVTDDNGYFSLNSVPAGNYMLSVQAKGYAAFDGWRGLGRINLAGGDEKNIGDIALMLAARITGRVVSEGGTPVAGANVDLKQSNQWGGWSSNSTQTAEDGTFTISEVEPGTYSLQVRAKGYALAEVAAQPIEPGQELNVGDIKLGKGLLLSGIVSDGDGKPVAGAIVILQKPSDSSTWFQQGEEVSRDDTDANGRFELAGALEGSFTLRATATGFAAYWQPLKVSGDTAGLEIQLARGGSVKGRAMDPGLTPAAGVTVVAVNHESQAYKLFKAQPAMSWGLMFGGGGVTTISAEDGTFKLANVAAGTYLVCATRESEAPAFRDDLKVENDRELDIGDLVFAGKGSVRITVTEDGVAVPELELTLNQGMAWGGPGGSKGTTDNTGTALIENIPAGTWYIRTSRDEETFDTDNSRRRIVIETGKLTEFILELRPKDGVHVHGRLTINGKAVFQDLILLGLGPRKDVIKNTKPQQGGYYEFIGLKTGTYILHARESDTSVSCKVTLELKEDGDFPFDYDFKGYSVSGTVSTPGGTAAQLSSVSVSISFLISEHPDFTMWLRGRVNADATGKFKFDNVMPGTYLVSASLEGVGTTSTQVVIGTADSTGLNLTIQQNSGSIKLTVKKLNGTPVSGGGFGMLSLTTPEGAPVDLGEFEGWFMLSEGGSATIPTVDPGTYTLVVKASGYMQKLIAGVVVQKGEVTTTETELSAAAELHLTFSNAEVTQVMLKDAFVRYFDAAGNEVALESNVFDNWGAPPPEPTKPTLVAKYIGLQVTEVRVKVAGYTELTVAIQPAIGKKIETEQSLVAE